VAFYDGPQDAERAGFRPCRRCRPRIAEDPRAPWLARICRRLERDPSLKLAQLAEASGIGAHHLQRTFKRVMGVTPKQYAAARRLGALKAGLKEGRSVTEAIFDAGFGSTSRAYERAPERLGMTPSSYRRGGRGLRLTYALVDSPLGRLLVAASERGVSSICIGSSDGQLERALREEYPEAELLRDDGAHARWVQAVVARIRGGEDRDVPLDIRVTAFQWRVFQALREIPPGQTRSYAEIAREIGQPGAARAVGRACAANPVAVLVPCHRAVGADGNLTGYRWGLERKRELLTREAGAAAPRQR
jgi:AraC family transcriptional regulator of adaptative response/methylated-DNA-[protein]-cysteine methyltransferase